MPASTSERVASGPRMSPCPLVSVVIPSGGNRPALLRRAVDSALAGMPPGSVEVLVVGNGPAGTRIESFEGTAGVRVLHVVPAQANIARNVGLDAAQAELIRFLDDDDYLEPAGAALQYASLREHTADICTGAVRFEDADGGAFDSYRPSPDADFATDMLRQRPATLPVAHVFRRAFLAGLSWDTSRPYLQDVAWMHAILRRGEVRWLPVRDTVGAWCQHAGERVSLAYPARSRDGALRAGAAIIDASVHALQTQGRMDVERRRAAAKALWDYAHQGFRHSPCHWHQVASRARSLDPMSRPANARFHGPPLSWMNPLLAEWLLYPLRVATRPFTR